MNLTTAARMALALALVGLVRPSPGSTQTDVFAPDQAGWHPGLDTLVVTVTLEPEWRSFLVGDVGAGVFADFMLAGAPTSSTSGPGLAAQLSGAWVFGARTDAISTGVGSVGLMAGWWFSHSALERADGSGSSAWLPTLIALSAEAYAHPRNEGDTEGVELGLRVTGIEVPWGLEERNPTLSFAAYRDLGRLDAVRVDLDADLGLWIQNVAILGARETGAHLEGRLSWAEDPEGGDQAVLGEVDAWSWRAGVSVEIDWGLVTLLLRVGTKEPRNLSVRAFGELALRFWPDAAPL